MNLPYEQMNRCELLWALRSAEAALPPNYRRFGYTLSEKITMMKEDLDKRNELMERTNILLEEVEDSINYSKERDQLKDKIIANYKDIIEQKNNSINSLNKMVSMLKNALNIQS